GGDELWGGTSRYRRRGDDDVVLFDRLGEQLDLFAMSLLGQLLRVPAGALAGLAEVDLEELRTERLHLLFHDRPRVECLDHRAKATRRGDGLETGYARADDEGLRRRDRARRRREHREELGERSGRE